MFTINTLGSIRGSGWATVRNCFHWGTPANKHGSTLPLVLHWTGCDIFSIFHRCLPFQLRRQVFPPCLFVGRLSLKSKSSREKEGKVRQTLREHCNGNKLEILQLILGKPEGNPKTNKNLLPDPQLEAFCSTHAAPSFSFVEPGVPYNP